MTALLYANVVAWALVVAYAAPSIWTMYGRAPRFGDPARMRDALGAIVIMGFSIRRIATGEPADPSLIALLSMSIVTAIYTLIVARAYGRD